MHAPEKISITEGRKILRDEATEAQIQAAIHDYLNTQRIPHSITDATQSFNHKGQRVKRVSGGWPDITACLPNRSGKLFACEVKSATGRLRPDQARTLYSLIQAGALVVVARSVDCVLEVLGTGCIRERDIEEIARYKDKVEKRRVKR